MAASNINRVVLTGNLTRDPELRRFRPACRVCSCGSRPTPAARKTASGSTSPTTSASPSGALRARTASRFLSKGRPVAIDGRLEWREWNDKEGNKRESIEIVADSVQFLGGREDGAGGGGGYSGGAGAGNGFTPHSDVPADVSDFQSASRSAAAATPLRRTTTSRSRPLRSLSSARAVPWAARAVRRRARPRPPRQETRAPGGCGARGVRQGSLDPSGRACFERVRRVPPTA